MLIFPSTAVVRIIPSDEGGVWEGRWSALEQYIKFEKNTMLLELIKNIRVCPLISSL